MARKGRNIYKRKDGRWEGRILYPKGYEKKGYLSFYGHSYKEVKEKMDKYILQPASSADFATMTVNEAVKIWFCDNEYAWKDSTKCRYQFLIQNYIQPEWGNLPCMHLQNRMLLKFANAHCVLSKSYLNDILGIMIRCCKYMNKMYGCSFPQLQFLGGKSTKGGRESNMPEHTIKRKDLQQLEDYLLAHIDDDTCLGILIAMYTGLRIGELCALRWADLDLNQGELYVRSTMQRVGRLDEDGRTSIQISSPKSLSSQRRIPLPVILISLLQDRQQEGHEYLIKGRHREYAEPRTVQYRFQAILKKCGIQPFNFHTLRHNFASNCLMQGFDFKSLSELLGHSNIQTTLSIYVHSDDTRKKLLMNQFSLQV